MYIGGQQAIGDCSLRYRDILKISSFDTCDPAPYRTPGFPVAAGA